MLQYNKDLVQRARDMRRNMTPSERRLWYDFLSHYSLKVYRQRIIHHYIADFYCHRARLVIEIDGPYHQGNDQKEYDDLRSRTFNSMGIDVMRLRSEDVMHHFDAVCQRLDQAMQERVRKMER